jgi:hypothetical protein
MPLSSIPRALGTFEYRLLRRPSQLLQTSYLAKLPEDNPRRLLVERVLGGADEFVGRLLGDDEIRARGTQLKERAALLAEARKLEADSVERRSEAQDKLEADKQQAAQERREAVQEQQQDLAELRKQEQQEKQQARERAAQTAADKQKQADEKANQRLQAVSGTRKQHEEQLNQQEKRAAEKRKEQEQAAQQEKKKADEQRAKADRLDELADAEKTERVAARQRNNA